MRVETVITSDGKERYMLFDSFGEPVEAVLKYLKYKDNAGAARNTLRAYCYHLKLFLSSWNRSKWIIEILGWMKWLHLCVGFRILMEIGRFPYQSYYFI